MNTTFENKAGKSLIAFSMLIFITMILHPTGGSFKYIVRISELIIISHSLALISLPFAIVGFWGLTQKIGKDNYLSIVAFVIVLFAILAAFMAAITNGIVLPIYIQNFKDSPETILSSIKPIIKYNSTLNEAFDYIYSIAFCISIVLWSFTIIKTKKMPLWIGYTGLGMTFLFLIIVFAGIDPNSLQGLRLFFLFLVCWIILAGRGLMQTSVKL
ncbi:MAG: hypothetical protein ACJ748_01755 [Flavisolibacter sp.]